MRCVASGVIIAFAYLASATWAWADQLGVPTCHVEPEVCGAIICSNSDGIGRFDLAQTGALGTTAFTTATTFADNSTKFQVISSKALRWIVYPNSASPPLEIEHFFNRSAWHLKALIVT